jgi:hypothetical protein
VGFGVVALVAWSAFSAVVWGQTGQAVTVTLDQPETAGICGFRLFWDVLVPTAENGTTVRSEPFKEGDPLRAEWLPANRKGQPGAIAFDALQRYTLVRFPNAAERIAQQIQKSYRVLKAELVLPWKATELFPPGSYGSAPGPDGYEYRANWGVDELWRNSPPRWHAVAFALRRPWTADEKFGPTFNAFIHGAGYWSHCGARDAQQDRHPDQFGPTEVSSKNPEGRMDVTEVFSGTAFGKTLGERLRAVADCGFLLQKWETYDHRYYNGCYEWATATGGRAILIKSPKLVVTLVPGKEELGNLGRPVDVAALAERLRTARSGGKPTAVLPSVAELKAYEARFSGRPAWMPEWQWQRVQELLTLQGPARANRPYWYDYVPDYMVGRARQRLQGAGVKAPDAGDVDREVFGTWIDLIIGKQPRGWAGFEAAKEMNQWYVFGPTLPQPARDAISMYWTAWMMPERKTAPKQEHLNPKNTTGELVHPMVDQLAKKGGTETYTGDSYFAQTGDWHGNKSFYRSGFNYTMSTQNFNTTAATGALLGGAIVGAKYAMEDGRHGLEHNLGRLWSWGSGSSQEYVDHYYFAVTVSGYKAIADFGPTPFDRLMGQSLLMKAMDELTCCYHPGLRRFIAGSSRTSLEYLLGKQDGLQYMLHTESPSGALTDVGEQKGPFGAPLWGQERDPLAVALQTSRSPWLPPWAVSMVDAKPMPCEITSRLADAWFRGYLGHSYGLSSKDRGGGRIQILGQWRRAERQAASYKDLVTLDARYGVNETRWANDAGGWIAPIGQTTALQHKNKLLLVMSPWPADFIKNVAKKDGLKSLQASIALFNFQEPKPEWEIYVDGQRAGELPIKAKAGQKITIRDGVAYLAVVPLPGTNLGRQEEVVLREGETQHFGNDPKQHAYRAALVIDSYNLHRAAPGSESPNWDAIDRAYAGFAVEMGDQKEWGSFQRFQQHVRAMAVTASYDTQRDVAQATFKSASDTLELGSYAKADSGAPGWIAYQRINGKDAIPPEGLDRDTTLTQQARTGRLQKNGAVLTLDAGRLGYLVTEPVGGAYAGFSPLSDLTHFALQTPDGIQVESDGQVGLCRVVVQPKTASVAIDYAGKSARENKGDLVKAFLIRGCKSPPQVTLNGETVKAALREGAYVVEAKQ